MIVILSAGRNIYYRIFLIHTTEKKLIIFNSMFSAERSCWRSLQNKYPLSLLNGKVTSLNPRKVKRNLRYVEKGFYCDFKEAIACFKSILFISSMAKKRMPRIYCTAHLTEGSKANYVEGWSGSKCHPERVCMLVSSDERLMPLV